MDLPDDLSLPLERGAPWWYWLAGRPALDFVNTRRERWWRNVETLVTGEDLAEWLVQAGLLAGSPPVEAELLSSARALREAIGLAVDAVLDRASPSRGALSTIEGWLPEALVPDRLLVPEGWRPVLTPGAPSHPARYALGLLARDAAEMLGTDQRERIRVCASGTCSARFYDRSRGGQRRWCSMQACGNVAKARRHRARHAE
ncbi:MAG TPA: ABATE domain-containing protein [Solirubrobacteraceae bacterium]|nr:ABATE domain-containing protein [Solirubrobacteraceae bacterium]